MAGTTTHYDEPLLQVLRTYWGYDRFLPLQREAMECVMQGRDSVVVLPTGGGKSLCFQAPAMCQSQLAVVVSPLISLMKDQVDALRSCGIPAACVNSTLALDERREVADSIRAGRLRLLYVAPERLLADRTSDFLRTMGVGFFAIDEAHCISAWGHDFRPEYRELRSLKEKFPGAAIHAYTATATQKVRDDIVTQLQLDGPAMLVGFFDRPNLIYRVRRREDVLAQICEALDRYRGQSGIIYCISRAEVEQASTELNRMGYSALPYHAGMADRARQANQEAFVAGEVETIVATVAFGMGIDKSNVRYVIHAGTPKSLEAYQQETGRAGRDGLPAECLLLYRGSDYVVWQRMLEGEPSDGLAGSLESLRAMQGFAAGVRCRHQSLVEYFGQEYGEPSCGACDVCLGELVEADDPLTIGQKILSCVLRVGERFGAEYIAQVLTGSREQRVLQNRHDQLSVYGLLAEDGRRSVREWIDQLVSQRFLHKTGEYQVLAVTDTGREVLRGRVTPRLLRASPEKLDGASSSSAASPRRSLKPNVALTRAFELFAAGKSLDEVAEAVERAKSTTGGYLEQYIRAQGLCQPQPWVDPATADRVLQAVRETGARDRLTPIYQALKAQVPYEQIRVVLACLANAEARRADGPLDPKESGEVQSW